MSTRHHPPLHSSGSSEFKNNSCCSWYLKTKTLLNWIHGVYFKLNVKLFNDKSLLNSFATDGAFCSRLHYFLPTVSRQTKVNQQSCFWVVSGDAAIRPGGVKDHQVVGNFSATQESNQRGAKRSLAVPFPRISLSSAMIDLPVVLS